VRFGTAVALAEVKENCIVNSTDSSSSNNVVTQETICTTKAIAGAEQ
jgi:hypothetical protein